MNISVVIPTFNSGPYLAEAVASVRSQTHPAKDIIVVDDGSTDDSVKRLSQESVTLVRQANAGVAMARNAGVEAATGDAIAFLDADDVWHPRKLELQVPLLKTYGLVASLWYDLPDTPPEIVSTPSPIPIRWEKLVIRNSIVTSTVIVKREILQQAGPFDRRMQGPEDYDLWLRVLRLTSGVALPLPLIGYRTVEGSLSKNAERMEAGMKLILEKLDESGAFRGKPLLRRQAHGYFHYAVAYMHKRAGHRAAARQHARQSLLAYPFWYNRDDVRYLFGRLRLLRG